VSFLVQSYRDAALTYEQLVKFHDDEPRYKLYYAQSLYKAGLYADVRSVVPGLCGRLDFATCLPPRIVRLFMECSG
jgi:hypothetical protein